jgi:hypothetical protein
MDIQVLALFLLIYIKRLIQTQVYQCAHRGLHNGRYSLHLLLQLYPHSKARRARAAIHSA